MSATLDGEQLVGVTAINTLSSFEDVYLVNGGVAYTPAAGERGWMKQSDATPVDGANVYIQVNYLPLFIEQNT